jgi:hypothetical protein
MEVQIVDPAHKQVLHFRIGLAQHVFSVSQTKIVVSEAIVQAQVHVLVVSIMDL